MPYESVISPKEQVTIIHDGNYLDYVCDPFINGEQMSRGLIPRYGRGAPSVVKGFDMPVIPRSEWADRLEEMEKNKSRLSDHGKRKGVKTKNQNGTNYCWCFATVSALEFTRAYQNQETVELSPASAACIIKRYQNAGGWGMEALEYLAKVGVCPVDLWPATAINQRYDTDESREAKGRFKVHEWLEVETFDQEVTCLLAGIPVSVGHNWWGHQVLHLDLVMQNGVWLIRYLNSHGTGFGDNGYALMTESKARPDDVAVAPSSIVLISENGEQTVWDAQRHLAAAA